MAATATGARVAHRRASTVECWHEEFVLAQGIRDGKSSGGRR